MRRPYFLLFAAATFMAILLSLSACQWKKTTRPSFLVVAIDRLGVSHAGCRAERDESTRSGLAEICDEGVRFTHAFTTSTLSAPAMGSLLTGLYPYRSGLRHNGGGELGTLSSSVETVAERAFGLGYKTLFVSSAPPLLRRTGLHQGFEVFDDAIQPTSRRLYRPAREVVEIFTKWLDGEERGAPFFTVLHMADMMVPWQPMPDDSGRVRESTVRSQFEEIDESLAHLWLYLKKKKRWESTTIVIVGLQGDSSEVRLDEVPALDLHSDTTHVTLLVKEGDRERYIWVPKPWSFDVNVSLADVGLTLFDWMDGRDEKDLEVDEGRSLRSAMKGPGESEDLRRLDRLIISESAWARWQVSEKLPIRAAFRKGPYLYIHDSKPSIYNTLTDAFEVAVLPRNNSRTLELQNEFAGLADKLGFKFFPGLPPETFVEERWARGFFSRRMGTRIGIPSKQDERQVEIHAMNSEAVRLWLELRDWQEGRLKAPPPTPCSRIVFPVNSNLDQSLTIEAELARVCAFRGAKEIARWFRSEDPDERARLFESIFRFDQQRLAAVKIAEASIALGRIWEIGTTRMKEFEGLEVLLGQPEAARLQQQIMRRSRIQPEL